MICRAKSHLSWCWISDQHGILHSENELVPISALTEALMEADSKIINFLLVAGYSHRKSPGKNSIFRGIWRCA
jgi:hypothetical protein